MYIFRFVKSKVDASLFILYKIFLIIYREDMKLINLVKNNKTKEALEKLETISSENLNKVDSAGKNILHW